ncbi:outer membrane beta-barrel protein [Undibacterium fentianense]|uniref:Outer membrane beta-barrel protein n=1 Tax=Undibacterium fentianense TaxID=2828728 RepID=A0A941EA16_9BURK|nr:outer membrane beta-barrel protein [Undibacterium fentianense]MBR7801338.1 outer membrane beta-barrel protein [Undibacterium fentianense]
MFKNKVFLSLMLIAGLTVGATASAQVYVAGTTGIAKWNSDCDKGGAKCDTSTNAFKLTGGYNVDKNFALEASYFSLGKLSASATIANTTASAEAKATGFELAGVLKHQLADGLDGFAKLGIARVTADTSASLPNVFSMSADTKSTQPVLGLGVTYALTKDIALRAEVESRRVKIGEEKNTVTGFSVGAQFHF